MQALLRQVLSSRGEVRSRRGSSSRAGARAGLAVREAG